MRLTIIGTGYVGLVTGACLAEKGHWVTCVDVDTERVTALNEGRAPIFEIGLAELLKRHVGQRLTATTDLASAVRQAEATFIAVGTPFDGRNIDLTAVLTVARQIGIALRGSPGYHLVVVKSTVVPGTTDTHVRAALEAASGSTAGSDFGLAMNPEFLSEGQAVEDCLRPDILVLGGIDEESIRRLEAVYVDFPDARRVRTNTRTAELIKFTSNALLATLISFSNEIGNLAAAVGDIDAEDVLHAVHMNRYFHDRNDDGLPPITSFLRAGCGFGGSCLPKDVRSLIARGREIGQPMHLLDAVARINDEQPGQLIRLVEKHWPDLSGVRVTVLGLSFKPGTNDVRKSPAFPLMHALLSRGARLTAYDPVAMPEARRAFDDSRLQYAPSLVAALADVDVVIVVTPWDEFRIVPDLIRGRDPEPVLVDGRRAYAADAVSRYEGIGVETTGRRKIALEAPLA